VIVPSEHLRYPDTVETGEPGQKLHHGILLVPFAKQLDTLDHAYGLKT